MTYLTELDPLPGLTGHFVPSYHSLSVASLQQSRAERRGLCLCTCSQGTENLMLLHHKPVPSNHPLPPSLSNT